MISPPYNYRNSNIRYICTFDDDCLNRATVKGEFLTGKSHLVNSTEISIYDIYKNITYVIGLNLTEILLNNQVPDDYNIQGPLAWTLFSIRRITGYNTIISCNKKYLYIDKYTNLYQYKLAEDDFIYDFDSWISLLKNLSINQ